MTAGNRRPRPVDRVKGPAWAGVPILGSKRRYRAILARSRGILLTVMIDSFFGIHPSVLRGGLWRRMKPGEKDLYVYLMEESERRQTRELTATDNQITNLVGVAPRTLCNARKKLQERGLIQYERGEGNKLQYTICNPKTGQPYPGNPRDPITVPKRSRVEGKDRAGAPPIKSHWARHRSTSPAAGGSPREQSHGMPLRFP
jgi:hypothetical protein